jgi:hypothetical protein
MKKFSGRLTEDPLVSMPVGSELMFASILFTPEASSVDEPEALAAALRVACDENEICSTLLRGD